MRSGTKQRSCKLNATPLELPRYKFLLQKKTMHSIDEQIMQPQTSQVPVPNTTVKELEVQIAALQSENDVLRTKEVSALIDTLHHVSFTRYRLPLMIPRNGGGGDHPPSRDSTNVPLLRMTGNYSNSSPNTPSLNANCFRPAMPSRLSRSPQSKI